MAGEPSWFEIGVADVERGRRFYGTLLGWDLTPYGAGGGFLIGTPGAGGGMHGGDPGATAMAFFAVDDLDAALATLGTLGGEQIMIHEEGDGGGDGEGGHAATLGRFAICRDDQGSTFGLHERPRV